MNLTNQGRRFDGSFCALELVPIDPAIAVQNTIVLC